MTVLALQPEASANPEALVGFLGECREAAAERGHPQLVSISLEVDALDPLAVLESIFEPEERHFYVERPAEKWAIAGAEAVLAFGCGGPERFARVGSFIAETLEHTVAVGNQERPFSGPHFFTAFAFADSAEPGEPFEAASVFVPRWQVALQHGGTVAVANLLIAADSAVQPMAERVLRAHRKFRAFDYLDGRREEGGGASRRRPGPSLREVGAVDRFEKGVEAALGMIRSGALEKIVLARAKDLVAEEEIHPLKILNGLRQRFPDCYSFSVANGRGQSFIGASPERLLRIEGNRLLTEALAGSMRRGETASEDGAIASALLRGEKELREHAVVVEAIAGRLAALGIRAEHPPRPDVRKYATVQHLHMPISATIPPGRGFLDIASRLHPTPAVGGSPLPAALARIRELEGFPRGLYAGAIGWVDSRGGGELFVGLRAGLVDGPKARLYAGNGIVAGSTPKGELAETELKFRVMEEAMLS